MHLIEDLPWQDFKPRFKYLYTEVWIRVVGYDRPMRPYLLNTQYKDWYAWMEKDRRSHTRLGSDWYLDDCVCLQFDIVCWSLI